MTKGIAFSAASAIAFSASLGMSFEQPVVLNELAEVAVSYYPLLSEPYTDLGQGCHGYGALTVSGSEWRTHTLYENDFLAQDGTMLSAPAGLTKITSTEFLSKGFSENPDYYTGRTLVFELYQGKFIGAGNSYAPSQLGAATKTVDIHVEHEETASAAQTDFTLPGAAGWLADQIHVYVDGYLPAHKQNAGTDYTVADAGGDLTVTFTSPMSGGENVFIKISRLEYALDPANWGTTPPRADGVYYEANVGTPSAVENYRPPSIFFKDEEARFRARFTTPRYMFAGWFEDHHSFVKYMRPMDMYSPMTSNVTVPADMAELTDASISTTSLDNHYADYDYSATGVGMRQANPILAHLDYCKNAYAQVRVPHINLPAYFAYPFHVTVQSTALQTGGAVKESYLRLKPTVTDFGEAVTLTGQSPSGAFSLDSGNKRVVIDTSLATTHEEIFSVTVNYTDVRGDPVSYLMKFRMIEVGSGLFHAWPDMYSAWGDNEAYYDNHWSWAAWADWLIDQLVAAGWSATDEVILELLNEVWNFARRFDAATRFARGLGDAKSLGGDWTLSGHGWMYAKLKKAIDDRIGARLALDPGDAQYLAHGYNITMGVGTWTGYGVSGDITNEKLSGYKQYYESAEGGSLSGAPLAALQAKAQIFITDYWAAPLADNAVSNLTGLSGSAHVTAVTDAFDANPAAFWTSNYDWYADTEAGTGDGSNIFNRIQWIEYKYDGHQAAAVTFNTKVRGAYEGGPHDDGSAIPDAIKTHTGFALAYRAQTQGALGAAIWNLMVARMRAKDPDFIVSAYGGPYETAITDFGQPWQQGWFQRPRNAYAQAIADTT